MATFSPSPAPRRSGRLAAHPYSPPAQTQTRRTRVGSKPPSRFTTPIRQPERLSSVRDDDSLLSGMDVDESAEAYERGPKADTVFAKSEELTAAFYAHLPVEVKQELKTADFYRDAYTGDVDTLTGYAVVASRETCFVWKYSQALTGTPTCYIFLCPQNLVIEPMVTPFHALVPNGPNREPGLILSSSTGQIRFWDGLGMGLAGGEHFSFTSLPLEEGEYITTLTRADIQTYIVSTSNGRLFCIIVTSTSGKYQLSHHPFGRPQSSLSLSRLIPTFWSSQALQHESGNINAVALVPDDRDASGRAVWVLIDLRLQKWNMSTEGWEELLIDEDISNPIREAVRSTFPSAPQDDAEFDLELLDLKFENANRLAILISYAGQEDNTMMEGIAAPRRIYAIVRLGAVGFKVEHVQGVPYQSTSSSGAPMHPRMQLIAHGKLAAIQFGDAVTLCARDTEYMDRLELKSATDRTLGVGIIEGETELLVLTAATMMKAYVDMDQIAQFDPETGRADLIKSIMTQAILYGSNAENPLNFSFPPEIDEDALMSGATQLSRAILESDSELVRPNHDLQAQMATRKERLSFLIKFINDNAVLTKMSQKSRQQLATDAEKLYAAHQLWLRYNEFLGSGHAHSILHEAVYAYMEDVGEGFHEDCVRAFFRLKIEELGNVLPHIADILRRNRRNLSHHIAEANRVTLTVLESAISYREYNLGVYGIELPLINPWTSQPDIIDIVSEFFENTTTLVESPSADQDAERVKNIPKAQMPQLASTLFTCVQERLDWLGSPSASDEPGAERERLELFDRFNQLRPEVLDTLRRNGFAGHAFKLAEDYRDFRSLASLCHKDTVYPPQRNPHAARIQSYIERFKEEFTTELCQWYIEHGELRTMFAQDQDSYFDTYFAQHPRPSISWIHDLGRERYALASQSLLRVSQDAQDLAAKHLMLSIGKLSHLAQLHGGVDEFVLDAFHDGLDFVSVHETLIEDLKSALASVRTRQSLEMQVDTIVRAKAANLGEQKAFQNLFKQFVRHLLQGKALSVEDAADVLSLKDNDPNVEDYTTALQLLSRSEDLPAPRREFAFKSVWRRIYIHDDWNSLRQTANVSDAELNDRFRHTALYVALQSTLSRPRQLEGYILAPSDTIAVPSSSDVMLRWPGISPEEVEALVNDYEQECRTLEALNLDAMYVSVRQLVAEDEGWTGI